MNKDRDLNAVYEPLKEVFEKGLKIAKKRGLGVIVTSTWRSPSRQYALWLQGRKTLREVNKARASCGLPSIDKEQNKKKITWVKKSYHNCMPKSMAIDFCFIQNKKAIWNVKADINKNEIPDYKEFANICKSLNSNIEWGGDWKKKDYCHIQWKNGINIEQRENNKDKIDLEEEKKNLISKISRLIESLFEKFREGDIV